MKKILIILFILIIFYLSFRSFQKNIYFDVSNIGDCNISIQDSGVNIEDSRLDYFFEKSDLLLFDFLESADFKDDNGVSKVISRKSQKRAGFNEVVYVKYVSSPEFAGSLSGLNGEMLLLRRKKNIHVFNYLDGIDTCDSKKAFDVILNTIEYK